MPVFHKKRGYSLLVAAGIAAASMHCMAADVEPGVSRALAMERASRISDVRYTISLTLAERASDLPGTETIKFLSKGTGEVALDYRDGQIASASLNGQALATDLKNGHLMLPAVAGENQLTVAFISRAAAAGKAITRYQDKDDGNEYFYSLFVPMDADMAFPCFDQPDLKGRFTLDIEHPAGWTVVANTAASATDATHTHFAETHPISTYLFAFAAGPLVAIRSDKADEPTIYVRKSQLARAKQEAAQVQQMAARGVRYFAEFFAQPFPFAKYDLVLIPGFPFGGMEHAGATFLNEDSVLFRSLPTANDYFRRDTLVLHETCHQWFGDLVTMRWFDDLWLKEGFAQYMAYRALATLEPQSSPWKHFYEDIKPTAYGIDETQGTTPIFQNIANLKDAKSAYGAIVYQKAPAILKQLEFRVGAEAFREGLRAYLKKHAYANAEWSDLIGAFKTAGTGAPGGSRDNDLDAWADAWIKHRGMPQIDAAWSCEGGKIAALTLSQHDVLETAFVWPISNNVLLGYGGAANRETRALRVDWSTPTHSIAQAKGLPCPAYVFANSGDQAYGRFLLDRTSETAAAEQITGQPIDTQDALLRSMLWGALWDNVHVAKSPPRAFAELALRSLSTETDESMARVQGGRIAMVLHSYLTDGARKALTPRVESMVADRMLHSSTLGLRIVSFRTFTSIAETPAALQQIKDLLSGKLTIAGLELKPLDRWNLIGRLIAMGDPEAQAIFVAEKTRDRSGEGQKYAYAVEAGAAAPEVKARYFDEYLHGDAIQEDWLTQSLRPFNAWNQASLTTPYLTQALNELPDIKQRRRIFFLGAWLSAFMDGQNTLASSEAAQAAVDTWLGSKTIDPDLRLKVLEAKDPLDRTVLIRKAFPN